MKRSKPPLSTYAKTVSKLLWTIDPMHTACNCNDGMENEYDDESRMIEELLSIGLPIDVAVKQTFDFYFWDNCLRPHYSREIEVKLARLQAQHADSQRTV
jgi:hypothetical protein